MADEDFRTRIVGVRLVYRMAIRGTIEILIECDRVPEPELGEEDPRGLLA